MKKIVLTHGLLAGALVAAWCVITIAVVNHETFDNGMWYGYASMVVAFLLVFVGVKKYRDEENGGVISFGKALKTGLLISLVASTVYVLAWEIDYYFFVPDYLEKLCAAELKKLKASGASAAEILEQTRQMAMYKEWYKNPLLNSLLTYAEIAPVAIVMPFIAALTLKRRKLKAESE